MFYRKCARHKKVKRQSQKGGMTWRLAVLGKTEKYAKGEKRTFYVKRDVVKVK